MINYISKPFKWFFNLEAASGLVLLFAAIIALYISNSNLSDLYFSTLNEYLFVGINEFGLKLSVIHWINDALMAIFFFFVTLEIKREFLQGELSNIKQALLPIIAAVGGMLVPALFYVFINLGDSETLKFARIMESLGAELLRSLMTLIAFTPILWGLSKSITVLPWIGEVEHALAWVAILSALGGTILLASVGIKLPGIEYDIQKEEAAYRKELVLGEDFKESAKPQKITDLYGGVRKIHYKMYFHYLYFNAVKWSYLQGMVIVPYLALAPTIVTGAITLGFVQQIIRAFGRVETSLQYLVRSWPIIVELISVWKRLREFEAKLEKNISLETIK